MEDLKSKPLSSLIFIPLLSLIFIRPFFSGLAYPAFEFYYEICVISLAIIILLTHFKPRRLPNDNLRGWGGIFLLLSAYIISTITSVNIQNSIIETLKFISYISMFYLVLQTDSNQKKTIIKTIVIAGSIISIYSIYQYFWGYQHTLDYLKKINSSLLTSSSYARDILVSKRAIGTFPSPNMLGGYLIMVFFLGLYALSQAKGCGYQSFKVAAGFSLRNNLFLIAIILLALILTKSLGAWLSIISTLFILIFVHLRGGQACPPRRWTTVSTILLSFIFLTLVLTFILLTRWERLMNLQNPQNSITQRLNYWRTAIAIIKDHPILGVGPGNFQEVFLKYKIGLSTNTRYAHNIFLHIWSETGILGLLGMFYLIVNFFKKFKTQIEYKFIFLAGIAFILHNLIDNSYFIPEVGFFWWLLLGIYIS